MPWLETAWFLTSFPVRCKAVRIFWDFTYNDYWMSALAILGNLKRNSPGQKRSEAKFPVSTVQGGYLRQFDNQLRSIFGQVKSILNKPSLRFSVLG